MPAAEPQQSPGLRVEGGTLGVPPTALELDVLRLLRISTTIAELAVLLSVPRRVIEETVESLRLRGEPIVGGNDGLLLTEDPDVLEPYLEARRRRMASIYLGSRALRRTLRRMRESRELTFWEVA